MNNFLYSIKDVHVISKSVLAKKGLAEIVSHEATTQRMCQIGPDRSPCVIFAMNAEAKNVTYEPAEQVWRPSINWNYWVGYWKDKRPGPSDLARSKQLAGHIVTLGDDNEWLIPVARVLTGGSALPKSLILGANGEVVTEELPKYCEFSKKAQLVWDDFEVENKIREGQIKLDLAARMKIAVEAIGWNYRIGADEVNLLGIITSENIGDCLAAIIDVPTLLEFVKKNKDSRPAEPETTNDGAGA